MFRWNWTYLPISSRNKGPPESLEHVLSWCSLRSPTHSKFLRICNWNVYKHNKGRVKIIYFVNNDPAFIALSRKSLQGFSFWTVMLTLLSLDVHSAHNCWSPLWYPQPVAVAFLVSYVSDISDGRQIGAILLVNWIFSGNLIMPKSFVFVVSLYFSWNIKSFGLI